MALGLRQLRYFLAVSDAGAVSRAAKTLNVAQSALSHQINAMEVELGVKLFERRARGVALTTAGRRLYEHAGAILAAIEKARSDVRTFSEEVAGPVTLGLCHTAISVLALDVMRAVREQHPKVHLTVVEGLSANLIERVLSGSQDIALAFNPQKDSRLTSEPLLQEEVFLIGTPELIGKAKRQIAFAEIPRASVLGLHPAPQSRAMIEAQILRNQISTSATLEIDSLAALRKALEAGLGCAILAQSSVIDELSAGRVHARRIVDPVVTRTLASVALTDRPQTRAFQEVRRIIVDVVKHAAASGRWPIARRVPTRGI